jgi:hypothetical protein
MPILGNTLQRAEGIEFLKPLPPPWSWIGSASGVYHSYRWMRISKAATNIKCTNAVRHENIYFGFNQDPSSPFLHLIIEPSAVRRSSSTSWEDNCLNRSWVGSTNSIAIGRCSRSHHNRDCRGQHVHSHGPTRFLLATKTNRAVRPEMKVFTSSRCGIT